MKKTYIKPENTVVRIKLETLIATSPENPQDVTVSEDISNAITETDNVGAREIIRSRDAWEEW